MTSGGIVGKRETEVIQVRRVGAEFADELRRLWRETFAEAYADEHAPVDIESYCDANYTGQAAADALTDPNSVCKVALLDETVIGFYLLIHRNCPIALPGESSELKQIYLRSTAYRTGAGSILMQDAMEAVRQANRRWMWLSVSDRNLRARAFYDRLGFAPLGDGPVFHVGKDRLTSTMMARDVGSDTGPG